MTLEIFDFTANVVFFKSRLCQILWTDLVSDHHLIPSVLAVLAVLVVPELVFVVEEPAVAADVAVVVVDVAGLPYSACFVWF